MSKWEYYSLRVSIFGLGDRVGRDVGCYIKEGRGQEAFPGNLRSFICIKRTGRISWISQILHQYQHRGLQEDRKHFLDISDPSSVSRGQGEFPGYLRSFISINTEIFITELHDRCYESKAFKHNNTAV